MVRVISFTTETGSDSVHSGTRQIFFRRCGEESQATSVFSDVTHGKVTRVDSGVLRGTTLHPKIHILQSVIAADPE